MQNNYGNPGNVQNPEGIKTRCPEGSLFDRGRRDVEYAGFWVRLAAYCIDLAIVWIGMLFVKLVMGIMSLYGGGIFQTQILFHYTLRDIILYVLQVVYFILLTYYTGTTLGKRLMNLRVINADGRERLELINVVYRETVGRFLCGLSVGIGYIMAGVDREKRGLHDMLCDTRVVYGKKIKVFSKYQVPNYYPPIPPMPPAPPMPPMPPQGGMPGSGPGPMDPIPTDGREPQGGMPGERTRALPREGMPGSGPGSLDPTPADGRESRGGMPGKGSDSTLADGREPQEGMPGGGPGLV